VISNQGQLIANHQPLYSTFFCTAIGNETLELSDCICGYQLQESCMTLPRKKSWHLRSCSMMHSYQVIACDLTNQNSACLQSIYLSRRHQHLRLSTEDVSKNTLIQKWHTQWFSNPKVIRPCSSRQTTGRRSLLRSQRSNLIMCLPP
jgi:hypothetical protein